jgi:hypothetical protein
MRGNVFSELPCWLMFSLERSSTCFWHAIFIDHDKTSSPGAKNVLYQSFKIPDSRYFHS